MIESTCEKCGVGFDQTGFDKNGNRYIRKFCSRKCANSKCWTNEDKKKKSDAAKNSKVVKEYTTQKRLNSLNSGKLIIKTCEYCGGSFEVWESSKNAKFCSRKCHDDNKKSQYSTTRVRIDDVGGETKRSLKSKTVNWQQWRTVVTAHAQKKMAEKHDEYSCVMCGYTTYNEACHIKSVASFGDDVTLNVINDPDNLMYMCRNHHWEFDHGLIKINRDVS